MHPSAVAELAGSSDAAFALISMASCLWLSTAGVTDPQRRRLSRHPLDMSTFSDWCLLSGVQASTLSLGT